MHLLFTDLKFCIFVVDAAPGIQVLCVCAPGQDREPRFKYKRLALLAVTSLWENLFGVGAGLFVSMCVCVCVRECVCVCVSESVCVDFCV